MQPHSMPKSAHDRQTRERKTSPSASPITHSSASPKATGVATSALELGALQALAGLPAEFTISLFLPTHRGSSGRHEDHIRLKNLLQGARHLIGETAGKEHADSMLAQVLALTETKNFWDHPLEGLALFSRAGSVRHVWSPTTLPELLVSGQHCHLKPLMPLLQGDGTFYLLELTQHGVQLHRGTRFGLQPIALPGAPSSLAEVLGSADGEHHVGVRTVHGAGSGSSMYFGTGTEDDAKENIKQYFRRIDSCICALLHAERAPLVTAGVGYLLPLYWEVNRYAHLIQAGVTGSPERTEIRGLHARAWDIVAPHFAIGDDAARERFAQLASTARTTTDLGEVLRAAHQGRIEDLFIAGDAARWGTYDVPTDKLREYEPRRDQDEDLLNTALVQTLATRAGVQVLPQAQIPGGGEVAAVLRY